MFSESQKMAMPACMNFCSTKLLVSSTRLQMTQTKMIIESKHRIVKLTPSRLIPQVLNWKVSMLPSHVKRSFIISNISLAYKVTNIELIHCIIFVFNKAKKIAKIYHFKHMLALSSTKKKDHLHYLQHIIPPIKSVFFIFVVNKCSITTIIIIQST